MKKLFGLIAVISACTMLFGCSKNQQSSDISGPSAVSAENSSTSNASFVQSNFSVVSDKSSSVVSRQTGKISSAPPFSSASPTSSAPQQEIVSVLIPPGFSVKQIAERMEAHKVCTKKDFLKAVNEADFSSFPLVSQITNLSKRCYRLEGYLYPDTYQFYTNSSAESVIRKILQNTEKKINGKYSYSGKTIDEIITVASLIEEEGGGGPEGNKIATVIYNRLKKGMPLQLDATVLYLEKQLEPADTQKYKTFYNTYNRNPHTGAPYQCPALPAGPICSPSAASLRAAVNPVQADYLYFSSKGNVYTFQTEEEWLAANKQQEEQKKNAN